MEDPLKKPAIWAKLKDNPNDIKLWTDYVGKRLQDMTPKEKEKVSRWKQELMLEAIADREAIMTSQDKPTDTPPGQARMSTVVYIPRKQLAEMEAHIREENKEIAELRNNVSENFVILEEMFKEAYKELGEEYRTYREVHPDRKYNEIRWIEEQETRLRLLKERKIEELRKMYVVKD